MPNPQAWIVKTFLELNVWLNNQTSFQDLITLRNQVSEIDDEPSLIDGLPSCLSHSSPTSGS